METKGNDVSTKVELATIVKHGDKLVVPESMTTQSAIEILQRQLKYDDEKVTLQRIVPCFPWDGAIAFSRAMQEMFGWVNAEPTAGFFSSKPPEVIQVDVGPGRKQGVPWGCFSVPSITGVLQTSCIFHGMPPTLHFMMSASVRRADTNKVNKLFDRTEQLVKEASIYRGQAIRIRFRDEDGDVIATPIPQFLETVHISTSNLIFSKDTETSVETNLFALLRHTQACREAGVPLKRGILFEGPYGVGKSLTAHVTAKVATDNAWTYLYCERADELSNMVRFAHQYQPAVVFCEDIDRVMKGERSTSMDEILNIIDGIESKNTEIIIVLTTNFVGKINKAMLRPGRLDAIISVRPPDAEAVKRLIAQYAMGQLYIDTPADHASFEEACHLLANKVPAAIREAVERAKLSAIKLSEGKSSVITPSALLDAAKSMQSQLNLMNSDSGMNELIKTREYVIKYLGEQIVRRCLSNIGHTANELGISDNPIEVTE